MKEQEFLDRWRIEEPIYRAWGNAVVAEVERCFAEQNNGRKLGEILKVQATPRVKDADSMVAKAFHRNKAYADPYDGIEDKVGVRFVVLLTNEITLVERAVVGSNLWTHSKDKDFESDRESRPQEFAYQSMHYVVRAADFIDSSDGTIPMGTPCEIQIRTLLQHAHSELTHNNIYKREPGTKVSRLVERTVAKSMALIEAVDDFFETVVDELNKASAAEKAALNDLRDVYLQSVGEAASPTNKTDVLVVHAFKAQLPDNLGLALQKFLVAYPTVPKLIKNQRDRRVLFRSSSILLAYFMAQQQPALTKELWPLTHQDLEPVYTDLGKRI